MTSTPASPDPAGGPGGAGGAGTAGGAGGAGGAWSRAGARLERAGRAGWWLTGVIAGAGLAVAVVAVLLPLVLPIGLTVVVAVALQPLVAGLRRRGWSPSLAALAGAFVLPVGLVLLAVLVGWAVVRQAGGWGDALAAAGEWLRQELGTDPLRTLLTSPPWREALLGIGSAVTGGVVVAGQVAVGLLAAVYILYYLLRDGPRWAARLGDGGPAVTQLRRYIVGTTVIAVMDAAVITLGGAVLRVPFLLTIAVVTFVAAFVPYLGAWVSAVFAVLVALGTGGADDALWMLAIVLVTQNVLEGVLRPYVFGRALGLHPLVVLGVTVLGAAVGGLCGVFLAPPLAAIARTWWRSRRTGQSHTEARRAAR